MQQAGVTGQDRTMMAFIAHYQAQHGYAPSIAEVTTALGISSKSVTDTRLKRLERLGLIRRTPGVARGMTIVAPREQWEGVRA